jgi:hypothetical protein
MDVNTYKASLSYLRYAHFTSYFLRKCLVQPRFRRKQLKKNNPFDDTIFEDYQNDEPIPDEDFPKKISQL